MPGRAAVRSAGGRFRRRATNHHIAAGLDYQDNSCALKRAFGDEQHRVILQLNDFTLARNFRASVLTSAFGRTHASARVGFQPGPDAAATDLTEAKYANGAVGVIFSLSMDPQSSGDKEVKPATAGALEVSSIHEARDEEITGLYLGNAFDKNLILDTGPMAKPMLALGECIGDLERRLGVDPQALKAARSGTIPRDQMNWTQKILDTYPPLALMTLESATVFFRLIVDAQGKVSDCYAVPEGPSTDFGQRVCQVFKSAAQFEPARDTNGSPIASIYTSTVRWDVHRRRQSRSGEHAREAPEPVVQQALRLLRFGGFDDNGFGRGDVEAESQGSMARQSPFEPNPGKIAAAPHDAAGNLRHAGHLEDCGAAELEGRAAQLEPATGLRNIVDGHGAREGRHAASHLERDLRALCCATFHGEQTPLVAKPLT